MTTTLKTILNLSIVANVQQENASGQSTISPLGFSLPELILRSGIGYTEADLAGQIDDTIAAASNADIDLVGGFTDGLGNAVAFAKIKMVLFVNKSTSQILQLKPAASNGWTGMLADASDKLNIGKAANANVPGMNLWWAPQGVAVTGGTGDLVNLINPAGSTAAYSIFVLGTSS